MTLDVSTTSSPAIAVSTAAVAVQNKAQKTSSDAFKEEMNKVSENQNDSEKPVESKKSESEKKVEDKKTDAKSSDTKEQTKENIIDNETQYGSVSLNEQNALQSMKDANSMLVNNIYEMMNVDFNDRYSWIFSFGDNTDLFNLSMNQTDAEFFINLAKNDNINMASLQAQAQTLLESGVNMKQIQKSSMVSQALLEALSNAREKNMPIRIDFDKDIAVILRVGRDGAIAAHFIPGDKAVEQYLKSNIDMLKNRFDENELPYSDLSYSHSSKEQNQKRRNEKQQGE